MAATSEAGSTLHLPWVTAVATIFAALALVLGFSGVVTGLAGASDDERPTVSVTLADDGSGAAPLPGATMAPGELRIACIAIAAQPPCP